MERKRVLAVVVESKWLLGEPVSEFAEVMVVVESVSTGRLLSSGSHVVLLLPLSFPKLESRTLDAAANGDDAVLVTRLKRYREVIDDKGLLEGAIDVANNPTLVTDAPDALATNAGRYEVEKPCEDERSDVRPIVLELCSRTRDRDKAVSIVDITMLTEVKTTGELGRFEGDKNADDSELASLELRLMVCCSFVARDRVAEIVEV